MVLATSFSLPPVRSVWPVSHQNDSQKAPYDENAVAPKVLPFANSHMPAANCAIPPYASASPNTTGSTLNRPVFTKLRTNVVSANAANPSGAGSARWAPVTGRGRAWSVVVMMAPHLDAGGHTRRRPRQDRGADGQSLRCRPVPSGVGHKPGVGGERRRL